jgi:hypothetical protein
MDRYDAILEHLKKAQSQGLDSVATRLDAIVESLGELILSAKTTVQSARPTDAEEVLPLAEVEALVAELRSETAAAGPAPAGISLDNLRTLDAARSQSELLRALLPMLSDHVGRAVVLVIRDGVISAWSGIGFADGEKLRTWHGGVAASQNFQSLFETSKPLHITPKDDPLLAEWLQDDVIPDEGVLLPISLRGKLMGIVYVDHYGGQPWNIDTAQSLNAIACLLIDTLHHRSTVPTPTLSEMATAESTPESFVDDEVFQPPQDVAVVPPEPVIEEPAAPEIVVDETPAPPAFEPPAQVQVEPPVEAPVEPPPATPEFDPGGVDGIEFESVTEDDFKQPETAEEVPAIDYDFEPEPVAPEPQPAGAGFDPSATVRIDATEGITSPEPPPAPEIPPPAAVPPPATPPPTPEQGPSVIEMEAPPPVRPVEPPAEPPAGAGAAGEEDARQEEARRFARLLVSEIKLYNEDEVERGRAEKDIGARLKEDIDRSREMYEKRIPADVRQGHDYFRDELVRILADGDADALGV